MTHRGSVRLARPVQSGAAVFAPAEVTGLVLAGGRGARMGGVDKGLQPFGPSTLARWAVERLAPQVGRVAISANRHLDAYASICSAVWPDDTLPGYAGPLAGFLAGLERCGTSFLVTVACDTPRFPTDLVQRLGQALERDRAQVAVASVTESGVPRSQPTFCLMRSDRLADLRRFTAAGGRKIDTWASLQARVDVVFDDAQAFANANTSDELERLAQDTSTN